MGVRRATTSDDMQALPSDVVGEFQTCAKLGGLVRRHRRILPSTTSDDAASPSGKLRGTISVAPTLGSGTPSKEHARTVMEALYRRFAASLGESKSWQSWVFVRKGGSTRVVL
jgi:hypothetical protein